ncbi:S41 family peptidase [uncultured Flavobacterium sp.]|uniref:S41 family peptidase n=1 Tax=uncultured Flavobacterium sp. TaxID=165435 RepID=UPI0025CC2305|nr:S41 family peptidase [uncultured Flavobacterium sp.]
MKKTVLILSLLLTTLSFSQKISTVDKHFYFYKVWNFTKYYHPALATGTVYADTLFFTNLPILDKIESNEEFDLFIKNYLKELPKTAVISKEKPVSGKLLTTNKDQKWFKSGKIFSSSIKSELAGIFENRYRDSIHHYIPNVHYFADIPNEGEYKVDKSANLSYAFRMLTLAKLQGAVDYLFPHKYLMDEDFDAVIKHNISLFANCSSRLEYEKMLLKVISTFDDTHSYKFINELKYKREIFKNYTFPPFAYSVFDDRIVVTDLIVPEDCAKADIKSGDIITKVNGESVKNLVNRLSGMLAVSNRTTLRFKLSDYYSNLTFQSEDGNFQLECNRNKISSLKNIAFVSAKFPEKIALVSDYVNASFTKERSDFKLDLINDDIAYFKIDEMRRLIGNGEDASLNQRLDSILNLASSKKGIVFDMRGYPDWGGFVHTFTLKKFGKIPNRYADYYEINKNEIGTYIRIERPENYYNPALKTENKKYQGKVVIIINPETLSMSEWNTMNLQHVFKNSITIGEQSAGADGDEKMLHLPGGYQFNFTGNAIFYPNGKEAQRTGVRIDKKMPLTPKNVLEGDYLLEEAIKIINKK